MVKRLLRSWLVGGGRVLHTCLLDEDVVNKGGLMLLNLRATPPHRAREFTFASTEILVGKYSSLQSKMSMYYWFKHAGSGLVSVSGGWVTDSDIVEVRNKGKSVTATDKEWRTLSRFTAQTELQRIGCLLEVQNSMRAEAEKIMQLKPVCIYTCLYGGYGGMMFCVMGEIVHVSEWNSWSDRAFRKMVIREFSRSPRCAR